MPRGRDKRRVARRTQRGFTTIELMVVVLIMGTVLLLVPANLGNLGSQGKLKGTADSLISAINGARDRAVLDAFEVHLEIGSFRDDDNVWQRGWRWKFTNVPPADIAGGGEVDSADQERRREARTREREWLFTSWHLCRSGVRITSISRSKGAWEKVNDGGKPVAVRFFADGTVEGAFAFRVVNENMETDDEFKTITVIINGLTSEASWLEGEHELPESLPASNFGN